MNFYDNSYASRAHSLLYKVFGFMSGGLLITASIAYFCASSPAFMTMLKTSPMFFFFLLIAQFVLVIALAGFLPRLSYPVALGTFIAYSILNGLTLSSIFLIYTQSSIAATFFVAAGMFGAMAVYGYVTKADLGGMGNILLMALIGIILAGLVNLFLQNERFDFFISGAAVIIFTLLTAYDVQRIKFLGQHALFEPDTTNKLAILGALMLYLDFINIFLNLLRFMGRRKE